MRRNGSCFAYGAAAPLYWKNSAGRETAMKKYLSSPVSCLIIYTVMHFLVDLSCIFYMTGMVYMMLPDSTSRLRAAVIYNMMAFALPMLLGLLADIAGFNAFTSCLGCLLILSVYLLIPAPWTATVIIGIGNGLFHIGGGRQVLMDSAGCVNPRSTRPLTSGRYSSGLRFAPSGIFISSGALGVFLGKKLSAVFRQAAFISIWVLIAISALVLSGCGMLQRYERKRSHPSAQRIGRGMMAASVMIFAVVIIRSYYGFIAVYSWNTGFAAGLVFTLCIVAGKFLGGIAADRFGFVPACVISLAGAALAAVFAADSPAAGCISILLFNMTMPITLTLLAGYWKELPGFAFGTLMMALFLGTLPDMVFHASRLEGGYWQMALCLVSLIILLPAGMIAGKQKKY